MAKKITPKEGEYWQRKRFFPEGGLADIDTGIVYVDPDSKKLMYGSFHWPPKEVSIDMVHGKNNWNRIVPSVFKDKNG
ncbi:MAG: hypothetical protein WC906_02275 [Parcubacteria group bacterium]|jgi:hypothetical protein